ncbi:MAG TPA: hypothetical protein VLI90_19225, partial [Tepidisphaeraceae bacterium]|nr:hypothetical protein [Tepidisphaeraceae bacterium]
AQTTQPQAVAGASPSSALKLSVDFEENPSALSDGLTARVWHPKPLPSQEKNPGKIGDIAEVGQGENTIDTSVFGDGKHYLYIGADGFIEQWLRINIDHGQVAPASASITMFRTRYVVLRYAFNTKGRELTGPNVKTGRMALTHFGMLPYFGEDWQVWQAESERGFGFGTIPVLAHHRVAEQYGFAPAPDGAKFDDLNTAPTEAAYHPKTYLAEPGLILFCRVLGNRARPPEQLGYGKVMVEDVTLTKPANVPVKERGLPK